MFSLFALLFPVFGGLFGYKWEKRKQIGKWFVGIGGSLLLCIIMIIGVYMIIGDERSTECLDAGGEWKWIQADVQGCVYSYSDGGKYCTSSDQCEGDCVTNVVSNLGVEGFCEHTTNNQGCFNAIENEHFECLEDDIIVRCDLDDWDSWCDYLEGSGELEK